MSDVARSTRTGYEYGALWTRLGLENLADDLADLETQLNDADKDGWEFVTAVHIGHECAATIYRKEKEKQDE